MKQGSGIRVGSGFDLKTDKSGKQVFEKTTSYAKLSFRQKLAKKKRAKTPKYGKERG